MVTKMKKIKLLLALAPFILSACGGSGGNNGGDNPASDTLNTTTSKSGNTATQTVDQQQLVENNINDFVQSARAAGAVAVDSNLTGIWMEVSGKLWTESGYQDNASFSGDYNDTTYKVHFVMDNGNSVDVSDCGRALTLYSFHFDDAGNLIWTNFPGDTKPVGTIANNTFINFGTTAFSGSSTTDTSTRDYSGNFTSQWIKLSSDLKASIGTLSGSGIMKDVSCASILLNDGTLNGDEVHHYTVDFRDTGGNWISTSDESGSAEPTRDGVVFSMTYIGIGVKFTLE